MTDRRDSALIETALDAAHVVDDFVRGVVDLGAGRMGADDPDQPTVVRRILSILQPYTKRDVVRGMAAMYAPEQLRKAANEADELLTAIGRLASAWTPSGRDAYGQLVASGIDEIPEILRRADVGSRCEELRDVHRRVTRAISVLNEARTKAVLAEIRAAREIDS